MRFSPVNIEERRKLDMRAGDTVRVWQKIEEKGKTRLQAFEGLVLSRKHGTEPGATFTVRKIASGVGVEKTFPLYSPVIDRIEVLRRAKTRRAKLYYIREKSAKDIRRKMKRFGDFVPVSYTEDGQQTTDDQQQDENDENPEMKATEEPRDLSAGESAVTEELKEQKSEEKQKKGKEEVFEEAGNEAAKTE